MTGAPAAGAPLATLPCGVATFGADGTLLATNPAFRALLGFDDGELEGRPVAEVLTLAGRIYYQTHLFPLLRVSGEAREIFLLLRRKDGGEVGALVNAVRAERGGAPVVDCVVFEVRERRKYEEELLRARRAAEAAQAALEARTRDVEEANERLQQQAVELELQQQQLQEQAAEMETQQEALVARGAELERARAEADAANRAKSDFLATMSHELRTPLNAIGGYAELLLLGVRGALTDEQRADLERIARSQRHLLRLVNEVLNLSRIEAGHVHYRLEAVPLAALAAGVAPMLEPQMAAARVAFATVIPDGLAAHADREKLQQVLLNLLSNAAKFTPPGGRVTLEAFAGEAGRVAVRVVDTGIGIAPDQLERVFEPFVQVDTGLTRRAEGTGLGLAISRDLLRGMGGDLAVESTPGAGSVFTVTLPRA